MMWANHILERFFSTSGCLTNVRLKKSHPAFFPVERPCGHADCCWPAAAIKVAHGHWLPSQGPLWHHPGIYYMPGAIGVCENIWLWTGGARSQTFSYFVAEVEVAPVVQNSGRDWWPARFRTASFFPSFFCSFFFQQQINNQWAQASEGPDSVCGLRGAWYTGKRIGSCKQQADSWGVKVNI